MYFLSLRPADRVAAEVREFLATVLAEKTA
jgi:hypothetical protein